jgi:outer membrane protein OmpA-like peptidoglycan-associated protein
MKRLSSLLLVLSFTVFGQKTRLPNPINTPKSIEYAPSITADGQTLVYQSDQFGIFVNSAKKVPVISAEGKTAVILDEYEAKFFGVYEAKLHPSGQWTLPVQIAPINEYANENMTPVMGGPSISYDGNTLFFFANFGKNGFGREDIYFSERKKTGWSKPENIGNAINTANYEGFPSISPDGKKLYFTREILGKKVDEKQCYSIMATEKGRNGKWRTPYELPSPINMDCEKAPRILADGKTLVYSSIKKGGRGDFDLYKSTVKADGSWSEPINLDFINSKKSDQFVSVSPCGDLMYMVSDGDIFTTTIPESLRPIKSATIQGFVLDSLTKEPLSAKVIIKEAKTGNILAVLDNNPSDGRYTAIVPFGESYNLSVNIPEYFTNEKNISSEQIIDCKPIPKDFKLQKIPTDKEEIVKTALASSENTIPNFEKERLAAETKKKELLEIERKQEEARKAELAEKERIAAETQKKELLEIERKQEEARKAELAEKERIAAETKKKELVEIERKQEEAKKAELAEKERLASEVKKKELVELERKQEEARKAELAEKERLSAETKKKELLEIERKQEEARKAELAEKERIAAEAKKKELLEIERKQEEARKAELAEKERIAAETKKKELLELERKQEEARKVELAEKERLAAETKKKELLELERKQEEARKAELAEKERIAAETKKKELLEIERKQEEARKAELAEKERIAAETKKKELLEIERKQEQVRLAELALKKRWAESTLEITLKDTETHANLNGRIVVYSKNNKDSTVHVVKNGILSLPLKGNDEWRIMAYAEEHISIEKTLKIELPKEGTKSISLDLELGPEIYMLELVAIDQETSKPIPQAKFQIFDAQEKLLTSLPADAQGKASSKLPKGGKYTVKMEATGYEKDQQVIEKVKLTTRVAFKPILIKEKLHELKLIVFDRFTEEELTPNVSVASVSQGKAPVFIKGKENALFDIKLDGENIKPENYKLQFNDSLINRVSQKLFAQKLKYDFDFRLYLKKTNTPIARADFKILEADTKQEIQKFANGKFVAAVSPSKNYIIVVNDPLYEPYTEKFNGLEWIKLREFEKEIFLSLKPKEVVAEKPTPAAVITTKAFGEISKGKKITLESIYFDQSSPVLRKESFVQLDELVKVLSENQTLKIEIRGHTDNTGDLFENVKLSKGRCDSVMGYLTSKGISASRLSTIGRGPIEPVAPNDTEENKKKNRRVEFMVL